MKERKRVPFYETLCRLIFQVFTSPGFTCLPLAKLAVTHPNTNLKVMYALLLSLFKIYNISFPSQVKCLCLHFTCWLQSCGQLVTVLQIPCENLLNGNSVQCGLFKKNKTEPSSINFFVFCISLFVSTAFATLSMRYDK